MILYLKKLIINNPKWAITSAITLTSLFVGFIGFIYVEFIKSDDNKVITLPSQNNLKSSVGIEYQVDESKEATIVVVSNSSIVIPIAEYNKRIRESLETEAINKKISSELAEAKALIEAMEIEASLHNSKDLADLTKAKKDFENGNTTSSRGIFISKLEENQKLGKQYNSKASSNAVYIATMDIETENYSSALHFAKLSTELDPENNEAWNILGGAQYYLGQLDSAEKSYNKSLSLTDESGDAKAKAKTNILLAWLMLQQGKYNRAEMLIQEAITISKENKFDLAYNYKSLAMMYFYLHDYEEAEKYLLTSLKLLNQSEDTDVLAMVYAYLGYVLLIKREFQKGEVKVSKAIKIFSNLNKKKELAHLYGNLGLISKFNEQNDKSILYFKKSAEIFEQFESINSMAQVYLSIGIAYKIQGDIDSCEHYYIKSLEAYSYLNKTENMGIIYTYLGEIYCEESDYDNARIFASEALKIGNELEDIEILARAYKTLGIIAYTKNEFTFAENYSEYSLDLMEQMEFYYTYKVGNINILGLISQRNRDLDNAEKYFLRALNMNSQNNDQKGIAESSANLGLLYHLKNNKEEAKKYIFKSISIGKTLKDNRLLAVSYCNLGAFYQFHGEFPKARRILKKSIALSKQLDDKSILVKSMINLAIVHMESSNYKKAKDYIGKAKLLYQKLEDNFGLGICMGILGRIYFAENDNANAEKSYLSSLELMDKYGTQNEKSDLYKELCVLYVEIKSFQKAIVFANKVLENGIRLDQKEEIAEAYGKLGDIYVILQEFEKAIKYFTMSRDTFEAIGNKVKVTDLETDIGSAQASLAAKHRSLGYKKEPIDISTNSSSAKSSLATTNSLKSLFQRNLESYKKSGDFIGMARCFMELGAIYMQESNYSKAENNFNEALKMSIKAKREDGIAISYANLGFMYRTQRLLEKAEEIDDKVVEYLSRIPDLKMLADYYYKLGIISYNQKDSKHAEKFLLKSLEICLDLKDIEMEMIIYYYLGNVYFLDDLLDKSERMLLKSIQLCMDNKCPWGVANQYITLGVIHIHRENWMVAEDYLLKSKKMLIKENNQDGLSRVYKNLANMYLTLGDFEKSKQHLIEAINAYEKLGNITEVLYLTSFLEQMAKDVPNKNNEFNLDIGKLQLKHNADNTFLLQ